MDFTVKGFREDDTAVVEVKWRERSTGGWIVIFVPVRASAREIDGATLSQYNPVRLRVIETAFDFLRRFPDLLPTLSGHAQAAGQLAVAQPPH